MNVDSTHYNQYYIFINFAVFKCDRNNYISNFSRGWGALISIYNVIACDLLPTSVINVHNLLFKFLLNNVIFIICFVYILPNSPVPIYESFMLD